MCSAWYTAADLMVMLQEGEEKKVTDILKIHKIIVESRDNCGNNLLIWSAILNAYSVTEEILKYNPYILSPNKFCWTALDEAAAHGHFNIFSLLIQHLAPTLVESPVKPTSNHLDVNADLFQNLFEKWLLIAARYSKLDFIKKCFVTFPMSGKIDLVKLLVVCAGTGNVGLVSFMLTKESRLANYAHFTYMGVTPLMNACRYGHYGTVVLLIEAGSQVNQVDYWGRTALHEAIVGMWNC